MTNPNVNLKLMGKDNLTSNVTVPNMPASTTIPKIILPGECRFHWWYGPVGTTVADGELYKSYKEPAGMQ